MYRITFWAKDSNGRKSPAYIIAPHYIRGEGGSISAMAGGKHINIKARDLISIEFIKGV